MSGHSIDADRFATAQKAEAERWDRVAEDDEAVLHEIAEHSEILGPLERLFGERVFNRGLEVGIGPLGMGFLAPHFGHRVCCIDGLDPLPRVRLRLKDPNLAGRVEACRARVRYIQACAEAMPLPSESYDIVSCVNVLDHAQCPISIMREIGRVLRRGGILVFGVSVLSLAGKWAWRLRRRLAPDSFLFMAHPHVFRWDEANSMLETISGSTLWCDQPGFAERLCGHGRMAFWIREKEEAEL